MASFLGGVSKPGRKKGGSNPIIKGETARAVIGRVATLLKQKKFHQRVGIEVTEVFKGGSMGQGTTVPGHYDIDLVVYSRSITVAEVLVNKRRYEVYFDKMDKFLKDKLKDRYTHEDDTNVAIKFQVQSRGGGYTIDIDLILSPYFDSHDEYLAALTRVEPPSERHKMFSVCASKYQTDFIRHQHTWAKEFIRRAKAWRNIKWAVTKGGRPKSYLISILVITAFGNMPRDLKAIRKGGMKHLIEPMTEEIKTLVYKIKNDHHLDLRVPGADASLPVRYSMLLPDRPRIIDPVNPSNNLYKSGVTRSESGEDKWAPLAEKIASLDLTPAVMQRQ